MHSMLQIVRLVTGAIRTPLGQKAYKLMASKDYRQLVGLKADPNDYARAESYLLDAQLVALFRKLEGFPTGVDLEQAAIDTFHSCEAKNRDTNDRLARYLNWFERGFHGDNNDLRLFEFLRSVRGVVWKILGPVPTDLVPRLSGGSTFYDRGDKITIPCKMDAIPSVTPQAWETIRDLWKDTLWARAHPFRPELVPGNRFTSVAKDSTKNRGICIEPSLNVAYQLALGSRIRDRLALCGVRIQGNWGAQIVHRDIARQSSVTGASATIDLANASDTVSYMLVKLLLPKLWFDVLSSLRSPATRLGGVWYKNQKFSSMGNGFTFELETLIFYALAISVCGTNEGVSVYGDDIIVPTVYASDMLALLKLCGFEVSEHKSFTDALNPFRESCGGDYFNGVDVRPTFLKIIPSNPVEWTVLANQLNKIKYSLRGLADCTEIEKAWRIAVGEIPTRHRFFGPIHLGDAVIHTENKRLWHTRQKHVRVAGELLPCGYDEISSLGTVRPVEKLSLFSGPVQLASAMLGCPSKGATPRDGISGFKRVWQVL